MNKSPFLNVYVILVIFEHIKPSKATTDNNLFKIDSHLNGFIATSGYIEQWTMTRTSRLECASSCLLLTDCVSFFIDSTSSICQFHSTIFQDTVSMTSSSSTVYYRILSNTAFSCGNPSDPSNGQFTLDNGTVIDSTAVLTCDMGYLPLETTITCTENGWTNLTAAVCLAISCGVPSDPSNGHFTLVNGTVIDSTAGLTCDIGYLPLETTITCTENGWTNLTAAVCQAISCGNPANPSNGQFTLVNGTVIDSTAVLSCDTGYLPLETTITCTELGWINLTTAICLADTCGVPSAPYNGYFTLVNGTTITSIATLTCDTTYLPFEDTIVCTSNGWSNLTTAVCRGCPSGWSRYDNTCYYLGHTEVTNYVALSICDTFDSELYSSSLIKFDTVAEREYVRGLMKSSTPSPAYGFWIGLYQLNDTNGSEAWLPSGQPLDPAVIDWFTGNASPEPNEDYQRCSSAYRSFDYQWTDIECANDFNSDSDGRLLFVICEIDL